MAIVSLPKKEDKQPAPEPEENQPEQETLSDTKAAPIQSSMKLSEEQEKAMLERAIGRLDEIRDEMGLNSDGTLIADRWAEIRQRNQDSYDDNFEWRKRLRGSIFTDSNFSLGSNKRYARLMASKLRDSITGTTPFFAAMPEVPDGDPELSIEVEEYCQSHVEASNVRETIREAIKLAVVRNECVVKTTYERNATKFRGPATVAVGSNGQPILTPAKQLYIFEHDDFVPSQSTQGMAILKKDPSFQYLQTQQLNFQEIADLEQEDVKYEGVRADCIDYRDFLCPLRVKSIHDADICAHVYDVEIDQLKEIYRGVDVSQKYLDSANASETDRSGQQQAMEGQGEERDRVSNIIRMANIAETYMRFDADGDDKSEEIYMVIDLKAKKLIFYDYLNNHMKKRPFEVIVGIERVPGRWYGRGVFSMQEHAGLYEDAQFNRINFKDSKSSSATFRDPNAVKEWKNGAQTLLGGKEILDVEEGYDASNKPPIFRINLEEKTELDTECMQLMRTAGDLQFGAISAEDASNSNLNQSKTATGNMIIERTANVLVRDCEVEITGSPATGGISAILDQVVDVILEHMDPMELVFSKDGDKLIQLNRDEIRSLNRNVRLLLTRSRSADGLQRMQQALSVAKDYRLLRQQDPQGAKDMRAIYIEQLKSLEVNNADEICPEISDEEIQAWQNAQQASQQAQRPESLSINYKDAPDSIKRQMEAKAGMTPLSPQQEADAAAQDAAEQAAKDKITAMPAAK